MPEDTPRKVGRPALPPEVKQSNRLTVYLDRKTLGRLLKYKAACAKDGEPVSDSRIALRGLEMLFAEFEAGTASERSTGRKTG